MPFDATDALHELVDDGRYEDALALIDYALGDTPDDPYLLGCRALLLVDLDRRDHAAAAARHAREVAPEDPFVAFAAGVVALAQGEVHEAIHLAQTAQHLAPGYYEATLLEARARMQAGQWSRVKTLSEQVLEEDPDSELAAMLHTVSSEVQDDGPLSPGRWKEFASRFPLNAFARTGRGWTRIVAGEAREAETEFRQALSLDPGLEWAREGLVIALKARNPVYRLLLGVFVRLNRLPRRSQNLLAIGAVVGYSLLRRLSRQVPEIAPFVLPLLVLYIAFVLVSWLADPLLSLLLMARADTREYLSRDDRMSGALVGACLAGGLGFGALALFTPWEAAFSPALGVGLASFPVAAAYQAPPGRRRTRFLVMAAAAATLALAGGIVGSSTGVTLMMIAMLLVVASTWMSRFGSDA